MEEDPETSLNVSLGTIDLGSFEVLSDHGDAEGDGDVNEFLEEDTGIVSPSPAASWFKNTETSNSNEMHSRKFRKPCNGDRRDEESPFFDCWDGKHEQSDVVQQVDPWARIAPKSEPDVKRLPLKLPSMTSPVREKVDLMKFQLKLPRVTTPQERVVSSRGTAYLWDKILRVTLKAR